MEFWNVIREDPLVAWFIFLALLLTGVPAASMLWRRMTGREPKAAKQPERATESTRFGNQTELVIMLLGLVLLLAVIGWVRSAFFAR